MSKFMNEDFLLQTKTAQKLYHDYAEKMPIYDFHNHLSAKEIYEDIKFDNITQVWLGGDHYKWRAMRTFGIDEDYITGKQPEYEKFKKWAEVVPYLIGNPLFHWTHLELQRYFGIKETLSPKTCESIWEQCNAKLRTPEFSVRNLLRKMNVKALCTTDDPKDSLEYHKKLKDDFEIKVLPSFRPDNAIRVYKPGFASYVEDLGQVVGCQLESVSDLVKALIERLHYFDKIGSKVSDHGMDVFRFTPCNEEEADAIFKKGLNQESITEEEISKYEGYILTQLGKAYHDLGWVMQIHIGAIRNNSTRMFEKLGPDVGFDSINDSNFAKDLSAFLNALDYQGKLPKTVLYNLNPRDNELIATMIGNFQDGSCAGKIQYGSGWWFLDQKTGMENQMEALSQLGLISKFIGMLTDSRSFLSFPRHEYFRRILCNKLAGLIDNGEYPDDLEFVGKIVEDICFNNAEKYFNVKL
ncbi:glucuronate isomerase [Anaerocolumna sp.]|uniref:glucuronate isomerase n=1 Tax=Anaerocolumna sp. TaxID=2041569 RepID=UPI0028AE5609|nr:glucuronate isomerase [Anaerocolumna sp.]